MDSGGLYRRGRCGGRWLVHLALPALSRASGSGGTCATAVSRRERIGLSDDVGRPRHTWPDFRSTLLVSELHGWQTDISTVRSISLQVLAEYRNIGTVQQDNVVLKLKLPPEVSYLPDSTHLGNSLHPSGIATSDVHPTGGD